MIDRQHLPIVVFLDIADGVQQLLRFGQVADTWVIVHVLERIDLERPSLLAADETARFVRRIGLRLGNQAFEL